MHTRFPISRARGISIIELVLLFGVIFIILSAVFSGLSNFRRTSLLNSGGEIAVSILQRARSQTLSSSGASVYGVHAGSDRLTIFKGTTYNPSSPDNRETMLPSGVEVSAVALNGGGVDVIFDRLTGATSQYGTVTLRSQWDSQTRTISILTTGIITIQ